MLDEEEDFDTGKALQLYVDMVPVLVIGPDYRRSTQKHGQILETFLTMNKVPFAKGRVGASKDDVPLPIGDRYRLVGAGLASIDSDRIELSDSSFGYNLSPDENHAREITALLGNRIVEIKGR